MKEERLEQEKNENKIGSGLESIQSNLPTSYTAGENSRGSEEQD
jgi:hypothetical protein